MMTMPTRRAIFITITIIIIIIKLNIIIIIIMIIISIVIIVIIINIISIVIIIDVFGPCSQSSWHMKPASVRMSKCLNI